MKQGFCFFEAHRVRAVFCLLLAAATLVTCGRAGAAPLSPMRLPLFMTGGDVSELARDEQMGAVYKDHGAPGDALLMFKKRGCNLMRLRLWVNPTGDGEMINNLPYTIKLGRRIKTDGFKLLLDLHYSDTWTDPAHQTTPAAWQGLSFDATVARIENYSREVITAMRQGGAMPDVVEVGNEINNGILWPTGHVEEPNGWAHLNTLLKAAIAGVHQGAQGLQPRIMIHIAGGAEDWTSNWFFGNLEDAKNGGPLDFDIMGFSYYPDGAKTLDDLKSALTATALKYRKPIIVVETAYPAGEWKIDSNQLVYQKYGRTPEGQQRYLGDLIATVKSIPTPYGRGVVYWAPEWIYRPGLPAYGNCPLWDSNFDAYPALDALAP